VRKSIAVLGSELLALAGAVGIPGWKLGLKSEPLFSVTPPPGLADRLDLGPCRMHVAGGPFDGWDLVAPEAWYKLQG